MSNEDSGAPRPTRYAAKHRSAKKENTINMAKFPEADARKFRGVFVCRRCKTKRKAPVLGVLAGEIPCRNCGTRKLRVKRKK